MMITNSIYLLKKDRLKKIRKTKLSLMKKTKIMKIIKNLKKR
jgi:hypothetical protein